MSRLSIEVTPEQHNAIKAMALLEGISIKEYVIKELLNGTLSTKNPGKRLRAAIADAKKGESNIKTGKLKPYKTAKAVFERYK